MVILERLGFRREPSRAKGGMVAAVRDRLQRLPAERAEMIATFAGLLARVAYADAAIGEAETASLKRQLAEHSGLAAEEAEAVATIVVEHAADGIDYASLTRRLNEVGTEADKLHLVDCLYAIATADESASLVEEDAIRAVARALLLSHGQFIDIRVRYKEKLELIRAVRDLRER